MNIVGLGNCGCNLAEGFLKYPQYEVYLFDSEKRSGNSFFIKEERSHEEYEINFKEKKVDPKHEQTIFFVSSSGYISGCSLRVLEYFKDTEIRIVLISPEKQELHSDYFLCHTLIFNALQDYARSGVFKDIILINNEEVEATMSGITFLNKYDKLNEAIVWAIHSLNIFEKTTPVAKTKSFSRDYSRILSIGTYDYKKDHEITYFSVDRVMEKLYYLSIPRKNLEEDYELVGTMKKNFKDKKNSSYRIYENNSDYSFGIVVHKTFFHQGKELS